MGVYKEYAIVVPEHSEVIITRPTVLGESRGTHIADMRRLIDGFAPDGLVTIDTPEPASSTVRTQSAASLAKSVIQDKDSGCPKLSPGTPIVSGYH